MWNEDKSKGRANKIKGSIKPNADKVAGRRTKTDEEADQAEGETHEQIVEVRREARQAVEKASEEILRNDSAKR